MKEDDEVKEDEEMMDDEEEKEYEEEKKPEEMKDDEKRIAAGSLRFESSKKKCWGIWCWYYGDGDSNAGLMLVVSELIMTSTST